MKSHKIYSIILLLTVSLIGLGCGDGATDANDEPATVEGRVEQQGSGNAAADGPQFATAAVEGATVTAAKVQADGSMQTVGSAQAQTGAEGEFRLTISGEAVSDASERIVVQAAKEGQEWKSYVTARVSSGSNVVVQPLTIESSGEAEVFQKVVADGNAEAVTRADIEAAVETGAAAELKGNSDAAATLAAALASEAEARSKSFASQSAEISSEVMADIRQAKRDAQLTLESRLHASSGKAEAYGTFFNAMSDAWLNAGVEAAAHAKASETARTVLINNCTSLSQQARADIRANASWATAIAVDKAVQARMEAAGASETAIQAVAEAGANLRTEIRGMAGAAESEVNAAFETYNSAIVEILQQEYGADASAIATVNSEINSTGGIKAQLETAISATASTDVIVEAYSTFYSAVRSATEATLSGASEAEANLVAEAMILINLAN